MADRSELAIFQQVRKYGADVEGVSIEAWSAAVDEAFEDRGDDVEPPRSCGT
jgi:hypothetical protein